MLCQRLSRVLSSLVSDTQATFVKDRSLVQNVFIFQDHLRHYGRKTTPRRLLKINLKKAYDMVQWEFVDEMLIRYGFLEKFRQMIMACVTTTTFSIKINGGVEEG